MTLKHQWDRLTDIPGNPSENLPPLILFFSDIRTDPSREKTIMTQAIKRCSPDKHPPLFWFLSNIHESLCQDWYKTLASWTNKAEYTPDILPNERVWWWRCSRGYVWVPAVSLSSTSGKQTHYTQQTQMTQQVQPASRLWLLTSFFLVLLSWFNA